MKKSMTRLTLKFINGRIWKNEFAQRVLEGLMYNNYTLTETIPFTANCFFEEGTVARGKKQGDGDKSLREMQGFIMQNLKGVLERQKKN